MERMSVESVTEDGVAGAAGDENVECIGLLGLDIGRDADDRAQLIAPHRGAGQQIGFPRADSRRADCEPEPALLLAWTVNR